MRRILALSLLLGCTACGLFQPRDHFGASEIAYGRLSGWPEDYQAQALQAFLQTCPLLVKKEVPATQSGLQISPELWQSLCAEAQAVPADDNPQARLFFERRFVPYRITNNGHEQGLFTGYYEPLLYGSFKKQGTFAYPLYLPPPELENAKPYLTHADIDNGALEKRNLELVWVDDPVMLFFTHIQGSGRVRFADGREMLVGYAGKNGRPYASLGKIMGDEGLIPKDQINFFSLRQWLYDHPAQAFGMMQRNPSYIFFKPLDTVAPVGAAGAPLIPQRSLAVDNRYIPYGLPLFVETQIPGTPDAPFHRLLIAQDTGGAIRGPVRGDIFFGHGDEAEYLAGYMKGRGVYSLLVPREIVSQLENNR